MTSSQYATAAELRAAVGRSLGPTDWLTIDQATVDAFARTTGDDQWIHTDPERARREGPFGGTVAHGMLTLALCSRFVADLMPTPFAATAVNYGLERVRFRAPVPAGGRVRGSAVVREVRDLPAGVLVTVRVKVEVAGSALSACVADLLVVLS